MNVALRKPYGVIPIPASLMAGFSSPFGIPPTGKTRMGFAAERVVGETDGFCCTATCPLFVWSWSSEETYVELTPGAAPAAEAAGPAVGAEAPPAGAL